MAIIFILAAVLFPVFARARENARRSSCLSNLKQMSLGILQYAQDYDERFPSSYYAYPIGTNGGNDQVNGTRWIDVIQPYNKSIQIQNCPNDAFSGSINRAYVYPPTSRVTTVIELGSYFCNQGYYGIGSGNNGALGGAVAAAFL